MASQSKAFYIMLLATIVPFYGFMIAGMFLIQYFFVFFILGGAIAGLSAVVLVLYGTLHWQSYLNLGTTIQKDDNTDKYEDITWKGGVPILGPYRQTIGSNNYDYIVACIKDDQAREWMIYFNHAFGDLGFSMADIAKENVMAKIRTSYITTVHLRSIPRAKADEEMDYPNWLEKNLLHRKDPDSTTNITQLYAYGTTVTAKGIVTNFMGSQEIKFVPPASALINRAFDDYAAQQLWLVLDESKAKDQTIEDLRDMALDSSELKIRFGKEAPENAQIPWKDILKWVGIAAVAVIVMYALYHWMGII